VYPISGTLLDNLGNPLAGANVAFTATDETTVNVTSGSDGTYSSGNLADAMTWTITPTLAGYVFVPVFRACALAGSPLTGKNFVGWHLYTISGVVDLAE
jgi:hypothetical protein